jgi:uncharacterized protein DUF2867
MLNNEPELTDTKAEPGEIAELEVPHRDEHRKVENTNQRSPKFFYRESVTVDAEPDQAFEPIRRIGGETGWYYGNWLWRLRGAIDLLIGGYGFTPSRRDPDQLAIGDTVDCMRVVGYEPDRRLLFALNMKVGGGAFLEFEVEGVASRSTIRVTAIFDPEGWLGWTYWHLSYPLHKVVFKGMLKRIVAAVRLPPESAPAHEELRTGD